jgi:serine protease Do
MYKFCLFLIIICLFVLTLLKLFLYFKIKKSKCMNSSKKNINNSYTNKDILKYCIVRITSINKEFNWLNPYIKKEVKQIIGSGFFIDNLGHIVTNYHVIDNSNNITISIPIFGKKKYECELISCYPHLDIAIIKLKHYKNKYFLKLGNSDKVNAGLKIIAAGYPLGQETFKLTAGIISGYYDGDLQIDSAINFGNSGGPLFDENYNVIGINYASIKSAENLAFSIPINYLINNLKYLFNKNTLLYKNILGCDYNYSNKNLLKKNNDICSEGLYISYIAPDTTLFNLGMRPKSIICSINNLKVDNYGDLSINNTKFSIFNYIKRFSKNTILPITYIYNKKLFKKNLILGDESVLKINNKYPDFKEPDYQIFAGMIVMELNKNHLNVLKNYNLYKYKFIQNQSKNKLIISNIIEGSKLHKDRIFNSGMIIDKINGKKVKSLYEYRDAIKKTNEKYIKFETDLGYIYIIDKGETLIEEKILSKKMEYDLNKFILNL